MWFGMWFRMSQCNLECPNVVWNVPQIRKVITGYLIPLVTEMGSTVWSLLFPPQASPTQCSYLILVPWAFTCVQHLGTHTTYPGVQAVFCPMPLAPGYCTFGTSHISRRKSHISQWQSQVSPEMFGRFNNVSQAIGTLAQIWETPYKCIHAFIDHQPSFLLLMAPTNRTRTHTTKSAKDSEWTLTSKPHSSHPPASKKACMGNKGMARPWVCRGGDEEEEEVGGDKEGYNSIQMSVTR